MKPGNFRAIIAALIANAGLAVAKFVGFAVTGASSLLAEGVHSVADTSNQALLLWGGSAAARAPEPSHPFGFGRERYFWSFVVALILFSLGSLFAIYEGVSKLSNPHPLEHAQVAVAILVVGIFLEGFSFATAVREGRAIKGKASWWSFIKTSKSPEIPVVLLEDFGALLGLVIALAGIGLSAATGDARFDASASIMIGGLLGVIAVVLAIEMKSLLIGESATADNIRAIRDAMQGAEHVRRIIDIKTQHLGPENLLVAAKVEFTSTLSFVEVTDAIDDTEARVREALPFDDVMIYLEPDVFDPNQLSEETSGTDQPKTPQGDST